MDFDKAPIYVVSQTQNIDLTRGESQQKPYEKVKVLLA